MPARPAGLKPAAYGYEACLRRLIQAMKMAFVDRAAGFGPAAVPRELRTVARPYLPAQSALMRKMLRSVILLCLFLTAVVTDCWHLAGDNMKKLLYQGLARSAILNFGSSILVGRHDLRR